MTGLDKILQEIQLEADQAAEALLEQEREKAEKLVAEAEQQAQEECTRLKAQAQAQREDILSRAHSAAQLQKRKAVLAAKQQIIGETIEKARQSLYELPDDKYFSLILKMIEKYALPQQGEIIFSAADKKRMPEAFESTMNQTVLKQGASLKISKEDGRLDGGFILNYGGVEENCSFEALFDSQRDFLQDKVHELLFS